MDLKKSINKAIAETGKSNKELAEFLNVAPKTISAWKAKTQSPSAFKLEMIAAFFEMKPSEFIALGE